MAEGHLPEMGRMTQTESGSGEVTLVPGVTQSDSGKCLAGMRDDLGSRKVGGAGNHPRQGNRWDSWSAEHGLRSAGRD